MNKQTYEDLMNWKETNKPSAGGDYSIQCIPADQVPSLVTTQPVATVDQYEERPNA
jgi:hypothetical protein